MDPSSEYWKGLVPGQVPTAFDYPWSATMFNYLPGAPAPPPASLPGVNALEPQLTQLESAPVMKSVDDIKHEYGDSYSATSEMYAAGVSAVAGADHSQAASTADTLSFYTNTLAGEQYDLNMVGILGGGAVGAQVDDEEMKRQKDEIRAHPLYPFLTVLFERCELATSTPRDFSKDGTARESAADAFKEDLMTFVETRKREKSSYYVPNPELDKLMLNAIQVLRLHLLELEKVHELCDHFCQRYVNNLRDHMPMDMMNDDRASSANTTNPSPALGQQQQSPAVQAPPPPPARTYEPQTVPLPESSAMHMHAPHDPSTGFTDLSSGNAASCSSNPPQTPNSAADPNTPGSDRFQNVNVSNGADIGRNGSTPAPPSSSLNSSGGSAANTATALEGSDAGDDNLSNGGSLAEDGRDSVNSDQNQGGAEGQPGQGAGSKRKVPKVFSKEAITKFRAWLFQNLQHPYPSEEQKKQLAHETGLTILQVNNWFINARRRIVQPMIDSSNRAGNSVNAQMFRNRRRKNSESNSAGCSPDPAAIARPAAPGSNPLAVSGSAYSPDPGVLMPPASAAPYSAMFPTPYAGFGASGFPSPMFMPGMVGAAYNMTPGNIAGSWMDFGSNLGSMDN